jgi:hypothetical protein
VDENILVEYPEGTEVPSAAVENVSLLVAGMARIVRAIVAGLFSDELIIGNPWITTHEPIVH